MRAFVYFNLTKKCFSVRSTSGSDRGRVILHARKLLMRNVEFKVNEAGRQRVLRERRKNVHAGIVGEVRVVDLIEQLRAITVTKNSPNVPATWNHIVDTEVTGRLVENGREVWYNPYDYECFVSCTGAEAKAYQAYLCLDGYDKPKIFIE